MGVFTWSETDEPHATRRQQIMAKHPEVGHDCDSSANGSGEGRCSAQQLGSDLKSTRNHRVASKGRA